MPLPYLTDALETYRIRAKYVFEFVVTNERQSAILFMSAGGLAMNERDTPLVGRGTEKDKTDA